MPYQYTFGQSIGSSYAYLKTKAHSAVVEAQKLAVGLTNYALSKYMISAELAPGIQLTTYPYLINYCFINPAPEIAEKEDFYEENFFRYEIGSLLNLLDQQENGRASYLGFGVITRNAHLLADGSAHAKVHRAQVMQFFSPREFALTAMEITKAKLESIADINKPININSFTKEIVHLTLAKIFFDLDVLPPDTSKILERMTEATFNFEPSNFVFLACETKEIRDRKAEYEKFANDLIALQQDKILEILHHYQKNKNIIAEIIIANIKAAHPELEKNREALDDFLQQVNENNLDQYLKDDFIVTVPSLLMLADNISPVIGAAVSRAITFKYFSYNSYGVRSNKNLTIDDIIANQDFKTCYHYTLRSTLSVNHIARYAENEIEISDRLTNKKIIIPKNTMVFVDLACIAKRELSVLREKFQATGETDRSEAQRCADEEVMKKIMSSKSGLFSPADHKRGCPGFNVAEKIFDGVFGSFALSEYEFTSGNLQAEMSVRTVRP